MACLPPENRRLLPDTAFLLGVFDLLLQLLACTVCTAVQAKRDHSSTVSETIFSTKGRTSITHKKATGMASM